MKMSLRIAQGDITKYEVDVIVNAANSSLLGGGGVDGAIHKAAGPELNEACYGHYCNKGKVFETPGFNMSCKRIFHTVGPNIDDFGIMADKREILENCYRNCLEAALNGGYKSISFPLISAGSYGYPVKEAMLVAVTEILKFKIEHINSDLDIELVVFDSESAKIGREFVIENPEDCVTDEYVKDNLHLHSDAFMEDIDFQNSYLESQNLGTYIQETMKRKGLTDKDVRERSLITKATFSRIKNNANKECPKRDILLRLSIGLKLTLAETEKLFHLSNAFTSDIDLIFLQHIKDQEHLEFL